MLSICLSGCSKSRSNVDVHTRVDFSDSLQPWDGFGVNYVQSAQWRGADTARFEDYGGFSQLTEQKRWEIMELIFGEDGLKPSLLKMFLDPYHQAEPGGPFDHESTTDQMRFFAREGLKMTREQGRDLTVLTTLYGPPAWATKQKFTRGRDLDPAMKYKLGDYMVNWVKYLKEDEGLPVKYLSLHNEGGNADRWDDEGLTQGDPGHDHNMYWPKEQIVDFLKFMPGILKKHGLSDVKMTPGETVGWTEMVNFGIAQEITLDPEALTNMGLITSHRFTKGKKNTPNDLIRTVDLDLNNRYLHSWVTSTGFVKMYIDFLYNYHHEIYEGGVNAIIPWALIQVKDMWIGGEPNRGCAIWVDEGEYTIRSAYHFYKSFTRMGMAGMNVVKTYSTDKDILLTAFQSGSTSQGNAFNVLNVYEDTDKEIFIEISGAENRQFEAYRVSWEEEYIPIGKFEVKDGGFYYRAPKTSSTTFFEVE